MANFPIEVTEGAKIDLSYFTAFERKVIISEIRKQLTHEPQVETRNRKRLRDNPIASWELRVGKYLDCYEVGEAAETVCVVSVGHKEHNVLRIRGTEVQL